MHDVATSSPLACTLGARTVAPSAHGVNRWKWPLPTC